MAVLVTATASGKVFFNGTVGTSTTTLYTAPSASANVTSPSATAYVKEIMITNVTSVPLTIIMNIGGYNVMYGVQIAPNDTKILTGLNTMLSAGTVITATASGTGMNAYISGVEVQ